MASSIIPQPRCGRYPKTLSANQGVLPGVPVIPDISAISLIHEVVPSLPILTPFLYATAGCAPADLAAAQAESVIPAQPILLIIGKPTFVLERVSAFLRGLTAIDIPVLEGGRITSKIIGGPCSGPRGLQRPCGTLSLFRGCASRQYRYQKTCRHDRAHRKALGYRNTSAARLELKIGQRLRLPPKIPPKTPRKISRPTCEPIERAALFAIESRTPG